MEIYDSTINQILSCVENSKKLDCTISWKEANKNEIIFKQDSLYELDGISGVLYTSNKNIFKRDEIYLLGNDLSEISHDNKYARIVICLIDEEKIGEGNTLYQNLRKIDYVRYHVNPQGYMMRISSFNQKECVRLSKKAIKDQISFSQIGKFFIDKYHQLDFVKAIKIIFVTKEDFDYQKINLLLTKSENITKTLDHLLNKVKMDCTSCSLQVICNEVEKKYKEDFQK